MDKKFVSTANAINQLPFDINRQSLYNLIKAGELKEGIHYIDIRKPGGKRSTYRLNVEAICKYFEVEVAKR
jgi:hypothetical protein